MEPSGEALQAADEAFDNWPEFTPAVQARLERALRAAYAIDSSEGLLLSREEIVALIQGPWDPGRSFYSSVAYKLRRFLADTEEDEG